MNPIWILGATGRSGAAVAARLVAAGLSPTLVGRDAGRLRALAARLGKDLPIVVAGSVEAIVAALSNSAPTVVVNTVGPFTATMEPIVRAGPPGSHYVDLSNELPATMALLAMHDEAVASGRTLVTGAGFGVLATESIVLKLCEGQPPAARVRVDAMADVASEGGRIGEALAATIIEGLATGGRRYARGRLVRCRLLGDCESVRLPDGSVKRTVGVPFGDLEAARRASGGASVVAASSMVPTAPLLRAIVPAILPLLRIPALADLAVRRLAAVEMKAEDMAATRAPRMSWGHARVEWPSGARREGWLRVGDAMAFTADVMAEVAGRLARGEGRPGAYTPGGLFGPDLAVAAGGAFHLDPVAG